MNSQANQLANFLIKRGVGPEVLVGICVERSLKMSVGLLGILKTGSAYIPLDPGYPGERLAFMLDDANVAALVTEKQLFPLLPCSDAVLVSLDSDWSLISLEADSLPPQTATPDNLAYVIYTSGSTGKPKGITMAHGSLCNLIMANPKINNYRAKNRSICVALF